MIRWRRLSGIKAEIELDLAATYSTKTLFVQCLATSLTKSNQMSPIADPQLEPGRLVAFYESSGAIRSRSVSGVVLSGLVDVPPPPARLIADWDREIAMHLNLQPGDVEPLPLARARARWPDYRHCVQAASVWADSLGLHNLLGSCDVALMACRGARYHHDGAQYGGAAFCNLFLSEDKGLDLYFPAAAVRVPLTRGTAVVFDTGQPHAVIQRRYADLALTDFNVADFPPDQDCTQVFLTWELPIEHADLAQALQIDFDIDPSTALQLDREQIRLTGQPVAVCPKSGRFMRNIS